MKKTLILIGICAVLMSMPAMSAFSTTTESIKKDTTEKVTDLPLPVVPDYDGTFIGALGELYKDGDEWIKNPSAYIAGVYRDRHYKIMVGNIYNLDEEQIGTIKIISTRKILVGRIENMDGGSAPIVGFLIDIGEDYFAGRLMSLFGPAPHMWGQYTPN